MLADLISYKDYNLDVYKKNKAISELCVLKLCDRLLNFGQCEYICLLLSFIFSTSAFQAVGCVIKWAELKYKEYGLCSLDL
jgi:hypothetical protein